MAAKKIILPISRIKKHQMKAGVFYKVDMRPIINNPAYGKFKTFDDALVAMQKLNESFNGEKLIAEDVKEGKIFTVSDAIDDYLANQKLLMTTAYHNEQTFNLKLMKAITYDEMQIQKHQIENLGAKSHRAKLRTCLQLEIQNEGKSNDTMQKRRKHWQKFFSYAANVGWVDANPITDLKLPQKNAVDSRARKVQKDFIEWLQTDGISAYRSAHIKACEIKLCGRGRNELLYKPDFVELMMLLAMTTGIRQGELRGLRRCDYSANRQIITTRKAVKHSTQNLGQIKTNQGQDRQIEVPAEVCAMLDKHLTTSKFQEPTDLIFSSSAGTPLRKNDFSNICKPIRKACPFVNEDTGEILHFVWGDLRHAFASLMIELLGANWAAIAESMGHTNANFTRKQYGHIIVDEEKSRIKREAASAILIKKERRL
jgi:integrase